jgi:hypothetical protein
MRVPRRLRPPAAVIGAALAATGIFEVTLGFRGLSIAYFQLMVMVVFFPAAAVVSAMTLMPLAWYGGRRGFAGAIFLSLCGAAIAGLPAFAISSFNPATSASERTDAWTVTMVTASMALAGAAAGAIYALILRPNVYYREP